MCGRQQFLQQGLDANKGNPGGFNSFVDHVGFSNAQLSEVGFNRQGRMSTKESTPSIVTGKQKQNGTS